MTTLILYAGKGTREFEIGDPVLEKEALASLLNQAGQLLSSREEFQSISYLREIDYVLYEGTNNFNDQFNVLHAGVSIPQFEYFRKNIEGVEYTHEREFTKPFQAIAKALTDLGYFVRIVSCVIDLSKSPDYLGGSKAASQVRISNQAIFEFKDHSKLSHDGLNFRSQVEIKIYEALVKRGLLILPLPVAVLGEAKRYREPDFVVIHKGKVGILEIHGDKWHPPETAAAEHERRRIFTRLGVSVYEIFGADRCWNDPANVVKDFLLAFER